MTNSQIRLQDELFYLGICGPAFLNNSQISIIKYSNNRILSSKCYGWCAHAMGLTTKRAKYLWTDISSFRPTPDVPIDTFLHDYSIRSESQFYILGSNLHWPPQTGHYGIAFQDRGKFPSQMN